MTSSPPSTPPADVLVVGAGPTGLMLANELVRHGLAVRIVDAAPGPVHESRALAIQPHTLEILEQAGLAAAFLAEGTRVARVRLFVDGAPVAAVQTDGLATRMPFVLTLPQRRTEELLVEALAARGVAVEWNTRFEALASDASHVVAELVRATHGRERLEVPWLVGCDGARSTVREALGVRFTGRPLPSRFALADVRAESEALVEGQVHAFFAPQGAALFIPLGEPGCFRFVFDMASGPIDEVPELTRARLEGLARQRTGHPVVLHERGWTSSFRVHQRIASHYRRGRAFICGDAAHAHSPVGGQGMNAGLQDAYNLAWKLALVHRHPDLGAAARERLLDSFEHERRPAAAAVLRRTGVATRLVTLYGPLQRLLRNRALEHLAGSRLFYDRILPRFAMLDVDYGASPIVDARSARRISSAGVVPGRRAPDVAGATPDSPSLLQSIAGTDHVVLVLGARRAAMGAASAIRARLHARFDAPITVHTTLDPAAMRRYGVSHPAMFLLRPDRYIAWSGRLDEADALLAFLAGYLS